MVEKKEKRKRSLRGNFFVSCSRQGTEAIFKSPEHKKTDTKFCKSELRRVYSCDGKTDKLRTILTTKQGKLNEQPWAIHSFQAETQRERERETDMTETDIEVNRHREKETWKETGI